MNHFYKLKLKVELYLKLKFQNFNEKFQSGRRRQMTPNCTEKNRNKMAASVILQGSATQCGSCLQTPVSHPVS